MPNTNTDTLSFSPRAILNTEQAPAEILPSRLLVPEALAPETVPEPTARSVVSAEPEFVNDEILSQVQLDEIFARIPTSQTVVLIDGANIGSTTDRLNFEIDYKKFSDLFFKYTGAYAIWYFNGMPSEELDSSTKQRVEIMEKNDIRIFTKPIKKINTSRGSLNKANMDVEITCTALEHCQNAKHIILMSGDGDFRYLVETLRRRDIVVTIISTKHVPVMAVDLRRVADRFIDLVDLKPYIAIDQ